MQYQPRNTTGQPPLTSSHELLLTLSGSFLLRTLTIRSQPIHYLRYADDMVFGIPLSPEGIDLPLKLRDTLRTLVSKELQCFALKYSWEKSLCPKPIRAQRQLEILGLLVFLLPTGSIGITIPMKRWDQRLTCHKVRAQMIREGLNASRLQSFLSVTVNRHINAYVRYTLQYPHLKDKAKRKIWKFLNHLLLDRSSQFIRETKCQDSGIENQTMDQVRRGFSSKLKARSVIRIEKEMSGP